MSKLKTPKFALGLAAAGLAASALAYGRVARILTSVRDALERMGPSPRAFLEGASRASLRKAFAGFRHRFSGGESVAGLLWGAKRLLDGHGSLNAAFLAGLPGSKAGTCAGGTAADTAAALRAFSDGLRAGGCGNFIVPDPSLGSACKRLCLFLRWMVRRDEVDPGGWYGVSPAALIVPLDTHMHRIAAALGLTRRRQADMRTALEITAAFGRFRPDDPARYDFTLTRFGIRTDMDKKDFPDIRYGRETA